VLQVGGDLDLGEDPFHAPHRAQLGIQGLEGGPAIVPDVTGKKDGRHPAASDFAVDGAAILV
jgi:hypothetical protein